MKRFLGFILSVTLCLSIPLAAHAAATDTPETLQKGSSGSQVLDVQIALRDLGYLNYRVTGKFISITLDAVQRFQAANHLTTDGQAGGATLDLLLSGTAKPAPKNPKFKLVYGPYLQNPKTYGALSTWAEISKALPVGGSVTIKDLYSDKTFQMQRTGGTNNAWVETISKTDSDTFAAMFGGDSTWEKRPVLATIKGKTYAAALFGGPGGKDTITDNNMPGGTELYFSGCASDLFDLPDDEMNSAVMRAANTSN